MRSKLKGSIGFTLVELLITLAIIGILAAIAIPNLLTAMDRARQKRSMADLRSIAAAWEARATDYNAYSAAGLTFGMLAENREEITYGDLEVLLVPRYLHKIPEVDGWKQPYSFTAATSSYGIRSAGKDREFSDPNYEVGPTTAYDDDLVFTNGGFVRYPEGYQVD